jgi:hypothetical protein
MLALGNGQVMSVTFTFSNIDLVVHASASMIICPDSEMIAPLGVDNQDAEMSLELGLRRKSLDFRTSPTLETFICHRTH